jgi:hypothetical protein
MDEERMHLARDLPYSMMIEQWHHRRFRHYHRTAASARRIGDAPSCYDTVSLPMHWRRGQ